MRLANKFAVTTGAGSGISRATAIRFAEEGAAACVADIDVEAGKETLRQIEAAGGRSSSTTLMSLKNRRRRI